MSAPTFDPVAQHSTWSGPELRGLVAAEARKTWSTSAWWALLVPAAPLTLVVTWIIARDGQLAHAQAVALASFAVTFTALFGAVSATAEYRHHTITTSYLGAADRPKLLVAKLIFAGMVGAGYAVVCAGFGMVGMLFGDTNPGNELSLVLQVSAGAVPVLALWAMLGVGLGTLLRNQVLAVLAVVLYLMLAEPIIAVLAGLADLQRFSIYLPAGSAVAAIEGLTGGQQYGGGFGVAAHPWWVMLLVFLAYAALVSVAGATAAQRRDIT
jgi:ABC-type transport system involved in multi-copper enzyme maturation permease subunit